MGYFGINDKGHVTVRAGGPDSPELDMLDLIEKVRALGLELPVLVRFSDILHDRIQRINRSFAEARDKFNYTSDYAGLYPIKVNQDRKVVEEIIEYGRPFHMGLEAGSKPELAIALAYLHGGSGVVVCNGYKDEPYVRLALLAMGMGLPVYLVLDRPGELDTVLRVADALKVRPNLGFRVKLDAAGAGPWSESAGGFSKFGLTAGEILDVVGALKRRGMLDCVKLIHAHQGSQITALRAMEESVREAARYFVELRAMGCAVERVDMGGGLGVDYGGERNGEDDSVDYSLSQYAETFVSVMAEACEEADLPHPILHTESGRALTAHHAVLVVDVLDADVPRDAPSLPEFQHEKEAEDADDADEMAPETASLMALVDEVDEHNAADIWHEALALKGAFQRAFLAGRVGVRDRADAEKHLWRIAARVRDVAPQSLFAAESEEEENTVSDYVVDRYLANFSMFQSLPDAWAVGQRFPILPLQRLGERPSRLTAINDLTCDSDGCINQFIVKDGPKPALPLHPLNGGEPYRLGIFLVGAYQEILGDLHNLFGDTHVAHVGLGDNGEWSYQQVLPGQTTRQVLTQVSYDPHHLMNRALALTHKGDHNLGALFAKSFGEALDDYTYLTPEIS
ncbi:putative arginine decarboxylase [Magnetofaba australis IT-1]|uniref:Arginine decarboxylase n=1 Tax=Magnetofaba australis IT-1 TaxID=1434232 RepID=A0A1Y2K9Q7_9PROT|nr:putative arginine decarboxylase [Magnetofaba australis IT-1]